MASPALNHRFLESRRSKHSRHPWNNLRCFIDVSGLLAVMSALLFITMPITVSDGVRYPVDMPTVKHSRLMPNADRFDAMLVAVRRDGKVYFGNTGITSLDQLPAAIRDGISHGAERKVYIRADSRARYGSVKDVLDGIGEAGVQEIAFLVEARHAQAP